MRPKVTFKGPATRNETHPASGGWVGQFHYPGVERADLLRACKLPACSCDGANRSRQCRPCSFIAAIEGAVADYRHFAAMVAAEPRLQDVKETLRAIGDGKIGDRVRALRGLDPTSLGLIADQFPGRRLRELETIPLDDLKAAAMKALKKLPHARGGRPVSVPLRNLVARLATIYAAHVGKPTATDYAYSYGRRQKASGPVKFPRFADDVVAVAMAPCLSPADLFRHYVRPALQQRRRRAPAKVRRPK